VGSIVSYWLGYEQQISYFRLIFAVYMSRKAGVADHCRHGSGSCPLSRRLKCDVGVRLGANVGVCINNLLQTLAQAIMQSLQNARLTEVK